MGTVAIVACAVLAGCVLAWISRVVGEYLLPAPSHVRWAEAANVPRRHLESLASWSKRLAAAHSAREVAEDAFMRAARYEKTGLLAGRYTLARNHPAAIALLAAKYPDGPPLEELLAIAGYQEAQS